MSLFTIIRLFIVLLICTLPFGEIYAQQNNNDILALIGTFTNKKKEKEVKAVLFLDNRAIDSIVTDSKKGFQFVLQRNKNYSVVVSKAGFYKRLVKLNTAITATAKPPGPVYIFGFQVALLKEVGNVDDYWLDFPIAQVVYDSTQNEFTFSKRYTNSIKDELIKMGLETKPKDKK